MLHPVTRASTVWYRGVRDETGSDGPLDDGETYSSVRSGYIPVRACGVRRGVVRWRRNGAARRAVASLVRGGRRVILGTAGIGRGAPATGGRKREYAPRH